MADEKQPKVDPQLQRRLAGTPPTPAPTVDDPRRSTDDDLRPVAQGGQLDPEAVARRWAKWSKYLVPAVLATLVSIATGIPTVISVYRDGMTRLEHKADRAQAKGDEVKAEQDAVYKKVTKPEIEELKKQIAELQAQVVSDKAAKRAVQRRRPIPVVPVPKPAPLPRDPAAVLQAPAHPAVQVLPAAPAPRPDGGQ